jgi:hypothetical protein
MAALEGVLQKLELVPPVRRVNDDRGAMVGAAGGKRRSKGKS